MMDLFPYLLIVVIVLWAARNNMKARLEAMSELTKDLPEKRCPPHKWRFEEQKDPEGEVYGHKVVCEYCGPLRQRNDDGRDQD